MYGYLFKLENCNTDNFYISISNSIFSGIKKKIVKYNILLFININ